MRSTSLEVKTPLQRGSEQLKMPPLGTFAPESHSAFMRLTEHPRHTGTVPQDAQRKHALFSPHMMHDSRSATANCGGAGWCGTAAAACCRAGAGF